MEDIHFAIYGDELIAYKPTTLGSDLYEGNVVITKKMFMECYKRWVLGNEIEG